MEQIHIQFRKEFIMKGLKKIVMVLVVVSSVAVLTGQAMAAYNWWTCDVKSAGYNVETGELEIALIRVNATNAKIFVATVGGPVGYTEVELNRALAVALAAISSKSKVKAWINWADTNDEIKGIRCLPSP